MFLSLVFLYLFNYLFILHILHHKKCYSYNISNQIISYWTHSFVFLIVSTQMAGEFWIIKLWYGSSCTILLPSTRLPIIQLYTTVPLDGISVSIYNKFLQKEKGGFFAYMIIVVGVDCLMCLGLCFSRHNCTCVIGIFFIALQICFCKE